MDLAQLFIGMFLGAVISFLAWRAKALNESGAFAAAITGGLLFGLGGFPWAVLLLAFFISSSGLSRVFVARKKNVNEKFSKGSRRDWGQVTANSGIGVVLVIVQQLFPEETWPWIAFIGAMAAVNADTWATELGVLSKMPPRLITSGKPVEKGTSGAVTWMGSFASLSGAILIGIFGLIFPVDFPPMSLVGIATIAGLSGSLFDSFLGATVQAIYVCPVCEKETEQSPQHSCGTPTQLKRGWVWLNNDWVNVGASLVGAGFAVVGWLVFLS